MDVQNTFCEGSSPLTRGAPVVRTTSASATRIIPAHAGSTPRSRSCVASRRDHPRSRGEHAPSAPLITCGQGSSPLTRGAPLVVLAGFRRLRIIPAHAGSTHDPARFVAAVRDHPRSRGEHVVVMPGGPDHWGSSPLTRGAHTRHPPTQRVTRIIPAHAGSTNAQVPRRLRLPDHPRSRGEHSRRRRCRACENGSSPLTRGAQLEALPSYPRRGIIPAHAGSTR